MFSVKHQSNLTIHADHAYSMLLLSNNKPDDAYNVGDLIVGGRIGNEAKVEHADGLDDRNGMPAPHPLVHGGCRPLDNPSWRGTRIGSPRPGYAMWEGRRGGGGEMISCLKRDGIDGRRLHNWPVSAPPPH